MDIKLDLKLEFFKKGERRTEIEEIKKKHKTAISTLYGEGDIFKADYITFMFDGENLIGYVASYKDKENRPDKKTPIPQGSDYISINDLELMDSVNYRGAGLCKTLLNYTMSSLKKLGFKFLKIWNVSEVVDGVPACRCYTRAAIESGYIVIRREKLFNADGERIKAGFKFNVMDLEKISEDCNDILSKNIYFCVEKETFQQIYHSVNNFPIEVREGDTNAWEMALPEGGSDTVHSVEVLPTGRAMAPTGSTPADPVDEGQGGGYRKRKTKKKSKRKKSKSKRRSKKKSKSKRKKII